MKFKTCSFMVTSAVFILSAPAWAQASNAGNQTAPAQRGTWPGSWDAESHLQQDPQRGKALLDQCGVEFKAARYDEAFRLCNQSLAMGNIEANHGLAILYQVAKHDYVQAAHYYEQCADKLPAAAHGLGWLYWRGGPGFHVDFAKARFYFEKAAQSGWRESITALGFMDELAQGGSVEQAERQSAPVARCTPG